MVTGLGVAGWGSLLGHLHLLVSGHSRLQNEYNEMHVNKLQVCQVFVADEFGN